MKFSYAPTPRRPVNHMDLMDVKEALHFVAPKVREAVLKTAAQLERLGIRHALAGGVAVGAHGKVGIDVVRVQDYLRQYAADLLPSFAELANEALAD